MSIEQQLEVQRAALMEAGADPDTLAIFDDAIGWNASRLDPETAWRSYEIAASAGYIPILCWECWEHPEGSRDTCEATAPLTRDCGRVR